ncbi:MAG: DUF2779 domain-containing protein, partial [Rhodothermales bacterium]|nr:DUF2779 domain-containing protein [Rhodothermales bacterium]
GGFIIEEIARQLHPGDIDIDYLSGHATAAGQTADELRKESVTLYEATFISNGKLVRTDILNKQGNRIELIEVKAKPFDTIENKARLADGKPNLFRYKKNAGKILTGWRKYLEDITFQVLTVQELYPEADIVPYLIMIDKSKATTVDGLYQYFSVTETVDDRTGRSSFDVAFKGDVDRLRQDNMLVSVQVSEEVEMLSPEVAETSKRYIGSLNPQPSKIHVAVSTACAKCEYRVENPRSGFDECWAGHGTLTPHVLDLYNATKNKGVQRIIESGGSNLLDLTQSDFSGGYARRQSIQLKHTRANSEWISPALPEIMQSAEYPLHFIDFETAGPAIPYFAGMRSYQAFPFQWSCHTIASPDDDPVHSEWLDSDDRYPGFEFSRSLREQIGTTGTVLRWGTHEKTMLRLVLGQMKARKYDDPHLEAWLQNLIDDASRMVDMNKLCLSHYFHPIMKGKTSIKNVCDAVWQSSEAIRSRFPEYDTEENVQSPYASLPSLTVDGEALTIAEGTGAMIAYGKMLYGSRSDDERAAWRKLLLQYCKLDTAAMVMIWYHWGGG